MLNFASIFLALLLWLQTRQNKCSCGSLCFNGSSAILLLMEHICQGSHSSLSDLLECLSSYTYYYLIGPSWNFLSLFHYMSSNVFSVIFECFLYRYSGTHWAVWWIQSKFIFIFRRHFYHILLYCDHAMATNANSETLMPQCKMLLSVTSYVTEPII